MPTIQLLTAATPNGQKISIALEEFGLDYRTKHINLAEDEQKTDWFTKINPNGRIPAIVDLSRDSFPVFESGAIFLYLVEHYDPEHKFSFTDANERSEMAQWLFFQNAGLGPMQGQANHFFRYAPMKIQYGIDRYQNECKRLYTVLESRLKDGSREYLVGANGGKYSVADMSTFTWVRWAGWAGIALEQFPTLQKWMEKIEARPAVQKGLRVPDAEDQIVKLRRDPNVGDPFQQWVMKGQNELKDKHGNKG
ncbi:hypothetical protein MMC13_005853 [Lambiella insularis]|nr:hypothetical protein [Lambiella insularis]